MNSRSQSMVPCLSVVGASPPGMVVECMVRGSSSDHSCIQNMRSPILMAPMATLWPLVISVHYRMVPRVPSGILVEVSQ